MWRMEWMDIARTDEQEPRQMWAIITANYLIFIHSENEDSLEQRVGEKERQRQRGRERER